MSSTAGLFPCWYWRRCFDPTRVCAERLYRATVFLSTVLMSIYFFLFYFCMINKKKQTKKQNISEWICLFVFLKKYVLSDTQSLLWISMRFTQRLPLLPHIPQQPATPLGSSGKCSLTSVFHHQSYKNNYHINIRKKKTTLLWQGFRCIHSHFHSNSKSIWDLAQ